MEWAEYHNIHDQRKTMQANSSKNLLLLVFQPMNLRALLPDLFCFCIMPQSSNNFLTCRSARGACTWDSIGRYTAAGPCRTPRGRAKSTTCRSQTCPSAPGRCTWPKIRERVKARVRVIALKLSSNISKLPPPSLFGKKQPSRNEPFYVSSLFICYKTVRIMKWSFPRFPCSYKTLNNKEKQLVNKQTSRREPLGVTRQPLDVKASTEA